MARVRPYYADKSLSAAFYDQVTAGDTDLGGDIEIYAALAPPGGTILELGAGTGRVCTALAARGFTVEGVEIAPAMLAQAQAHRAGLAPEAQARLTLKLGDMTALPPGPAVDLAVCPFFTLAHVPARTAWPLPQGMDVRIGACIPIPFGTAHECLFEFGRMQKGEVVLVQAGASGVGIAAIQLAARAGASMVLATASSDERLEKLKPYGLTHGINYERDDVVSEVMRLTDKKGADVVVDPVGGSTLQSSILSLAYRGRVSMVGNAGREAMKVDVSTMMGGNRSLSGVFLGAEIGTDRVHNLIQGLIDDVAKRELKVVIDRQFKLSEAADAHRFIESRQAVGRVLLIP